MVAEVDSILEGGACLLDEAGRERVQEACRMVIKSAEKLTMPQRQQKLQAELARASIGQQPWQDTGACEMVDRGEGFAAKEEESALNTLFLPSEL